MEQSPTTARAGVTSTLPLGEPPQKGFVANAEASRDAFCCTVNSIVVGACADEDASYWPSSRLSSKLPFCSELEGEHGVPKLRKRQSG